MPPIKGVYRGAAGSELSASVRMTRSDVSPSRAWMGDHLIVMHSAVRALPGYNRHDAPAIYMDGPSTARETEHGRAVTAQLDAPQTRSARRCTPAVSALGAAHVAKGVRRQAREAAARTTSTPGWG